MWGSYAAKRSFRQVLPGHSLLLVSREKTRNVKILSSGSFFSLSRAGMKAERARVLVTVSGVRYEALLTEIESQTKILPTEEIDFDYFVSTERRHPEDGHPVADSENVLELTQADVECIKNFFR